MVVHASAVIRFSAPMTSHLSTTQWTELVGRANLFSRDSADLATATCIPSGQPFRSAKSWACSTRSRQCALLVQPSQIIGRGKGRRHAM